MSEPDSQLVCTLPPGQRADQAAEWQALAAHAITVETTPTGIVASYPIDMAPIIEDLADREIACCGSWLQIAHEREGDAIRVRLETPLVEAQALIQSLGNRRSCG